MLTAEQMNALYQKVKAEMTRRNACGPLTNYASDAYKVAVEKDAIITAVDGKKVIEPILAVKDYGDLKFPVAEESIPDSFGEALLTYMDQLAAETMKSTTTTCRGACSGLCVAGCSDACTGCKGACTGCGGCSASCGTGCASGSRY